jgi:hypothetical protein
MAGTLLIRRQLIVLDRSRTPTGQDALSRIGRDWLEECAVSVEDGSLELGPPQALHGGEFTAKSGSYVADGAGVAVIGQVSLWSLVGDLTADYAVGTNPMEAARRGYINPPPDVWLGPPPFQLLSAELLNASEVSCSPADNQIAFSSFGGPLGTVVTVLGDWRMRYGGWSSFESDLLEWSPDGSELWLIDSGSPRVLNLSDGILRSTALEDGCQGIAWSADGKALAATRRGGLEVLRADGSRKAHDVGSAWRPLWLDDKHVLFNSREEVRSPEGWDLDGVRLLRTTDGQVETVIHPSEVEEGVFSVPDRVCAVRETRVRVSRWWDDLITDELGQAPVFPDIPPLDEGLQMIRDDKLRLMESSQPELYQRYREEWG